MVLGSRATAVHLCLHGNGVQEQELHQPPLGGPPAAMAAPSFPKEPLLRCNGNRTGVRKAMRPVMSRGTQCRSTRSPLL